MAHAAGPSPCRSPASSPVPRHFTLAQAQGALRELEPLLRDACGHKAALAGAAAELHAEGERIRFAVGALVDHGRLARIAERRDEAAGRLRATLDMIQESGCLVKDLDLGLLDFPTLLRSEEVYLCWKLGESEIAFWHGVSEGYRGRQPIDRDFLENHRGG